MLLVVLCWIALCCAAKHVCPLAHNDLPAEQQPIVTDCGTKFARGRCDEQLECHPLATGNIRNQTCHIKIPCSVANEACLCADLITCQRRVGNNKTALLLCDTLQKHAKRQESHSETDGPSGDTGPTDDTGTFLAVIGLSYLVILCIALIYIRPTE